MDEIIKKAYLSRLEDCLPVDFSDGVKFGVGLCKDKKYTEEDVIKLMSMATKWDTFKDGDLEYGMDMDNFFKYLINSLNKKD